MLRSILADAVRCCGQRNVICGVEVPMHVGSRIKVVAARLNLLCPAARLRECSSTETDFA